MTPTQLKLKLETLSPQTQAEIVDLTGTEDHYQAMIVSPIFEGRTMMEHHRMIYKLLEAEVASGEVHALTLKTYTPEQFNKINSK